MFPSILGGSTGIRTPDLWIKKAPQPNAIEADRSKTAAAESATEPDQTPRPTLPPTPDAIEIALAEALRAATGAGQWGVVSELARQLEARRASREQVVQLDVERERRGVK